MAEPYPNEKLPQLRHWYAFRVFTRREEAAKAELERDLAEFPEIEFTILVPKRELAEWKGGKKRIVFKTMFPGYMIVGTGQISEFLRIAKRNRYVFYALTVAIPEDPEKPNGPEISIFQEIYPDEISRLIHMQDDDGVIAVSEVEYGKDNRIRVLAGPLKGYEDGIVAVNRRRGRVKVKFMWANIQREIWLGVRAAESTDDKDI
ncbi:MAG: hypothetical protein LBK23_03690 [Oscillospiraceae bacterium]|jgi:transcriptional antiterminator NusG|nr:hypothetical protein [Oscillospiraceae bacterium]